MRKFLLTAWCLLPVGAGAYHYGPGQDRLLLDDAGRLIEEATAHAERARALAEDEGDEIAKAAWAEAESAWGEALALLPEENVDTRREVRLERSKAQMFLSQLPSANRELQGLVDEMVADEASDPELLREARRTLANSEYYMTWLLRLEGAGREEWEPRIENARQNLKRVVLETEAGDEEEEVREDLEAVVRLARMELSDLQGLPLPSQ